MLSDDLITQQTMNWVRSFVIEYNICPFAKHVVKQGTLLVSVLRARTNVSLLEACMDALVRMDTHPDIETMLLVVPDLFVGKEEGFAHFLDYLDFVAEVEDCMLQEGYEGVYQLATFHPEYCFAGVDPQEVSNYTNRSPYPMLHILRESSLDQAIAYYGDTDNIPADNIATMQRLGLDKIRRILSEV